MYPLISVVIVGYKRIDELKRTHSSFLKNINYPRDRMELILCDDGSPDEMQQEMKKLDFDKFILSSKNEGIGINTNKGLIAATGDYIVQLQDDWIYDGNPNILQLSLSVFNRYKDIGMIRFRNAKIAEYDEIVNFEGKSVYKYSNNFNKSKIAGDYPYTDNPHIKKKEFHNVLGLYLQNKPMHLTELKSCQRVSKQNHLKIAYIDDLNGFIHIGAENSFNPSLKKEKFVKKLEENVISNFALKLYRKLKITK